MILAGEVLLLNRRKKRGQQQDYRGKSGAPCSEEETMEGSVIIWKVSIFLEISIRTGLVIGLFFVGVFCFSFF